MRVSLSSLYNTFGDKRTMFLAALERYDTQILSRRLDHLERNHPPLDAIRGLFQSIAADCAADPVRRGCFLVNTALEMSPHDSGIEHEVRRKLESIEAFLLRALESAQSLGDLPVGRDSKVMAAQLLGALLGIRVLARANPDPETLYRVIQGTLAILEG
jgi:TetR/AcrR family transcriptional repressor of nem operon